MGRKISLLLSLITLGLTAQYSFSSPQLETVEGEKCFRNCHGAVPKICYFRFNLEYYHVLGPACGKCGDSMEGSSDCYNKQCVTADGFERGMLSINRRLPGPDISVCMNDIVVVDVINKIGGTSTTIHWHGLHMRKTPYYDGVPYITQCPISFATTFRYQFQASEPGTHFYHSHSGHHRTNGISGPLIVRQSHENEKNIDTYDHDKREHFIFLNDWMELYAEMMMPGLKTLTHGLRPHNFLINGKGKRFDKTTRKPTTASPLEVFRVQRGQRYRFRVINSMSHVCPALLEIEKHSLLVIATDGSDVLPVPVDSLYSQPGERYDFVIEANQIGDQFLIRVKGVGYCSDLHLQQFAVLTYVDDYEAQTDPGIAFPQGEFPDYWREFGDGPSLNHPNASCNSPDVKDVCVSHLSSYDDSSHITQGRPDHRIYLGFDNVFLKLEEVFGNEDYEHFINLEAFLVHVGAINNITFHYPPFSLLTQPELIRDHLFCEKDKRPKKCENSRVCHCLNRMKVELNSIIEVVAVDEIESIDILNHPFHLHGYKFYIMGMGQHPDEIPMTVELAKALREADELPLISGTRYAAKDTISIPSRGYTVFRFKADNPGWWFVHCHFEYHTENGMAAVLQVGDTCQMAKPPKDFPTCNNFKPLVDSSITIEHEEK